MTLSTSRRNSAVVTVHLNVDSTGDLEASTFDLFTSSATALAAIYSFVFEEKVGGRARSETGAVRISTDLIYADTTIGPVARGTLLMGCSYAAGSASHVVKLRLAVCIFHKSHLGTCKSCGWRDLGRGSRA